MVIENGFAQQHAVTSAYDEKNFKQNRKSFVG